MQNENIGTEDENTLKWTAMSLYVAGGDTSVAALSCFFLAMTLFPEVQRKAHEEIERVVGNNRLPVFGDDLPYIEAIATEALRWHPAVPLAFPHISENSDMYNGYLIPKGALIITNSWWLLHDPEIYEEPMAFRPERFLPTNPEREPDPRNCCFGYGRRICPGRLLADNSIFLTIAQCLAAFNISKAIDEAGKEIEPTVEFTPGIVSHPVPFKCTITPRSQKYEKLIKNVEMEFPWEESNAQDLGIALSESTKR